MAIPALTTRMTMGQALRGVTQDRPGREALVCGPLRLTYGDLQARVEEVASDLARLGLGHGDRVVLLLPPGAEFVTFFFAAAELGAVVVPLDPLARSRWTAGAVEQVEPVALVAWEPPPPEILRALPERASVLAAREGGWSAPSLAKLDEESAGASAPQEVAPEDLLAVLYTSGTTGSPKGTMHTHRSLVAPVVASLKLRELWIRRPTLQHLPRMGRALLRYRERLLRAAGRPQVMLSTVGFHTVTGVEVFLQALLMGDKLVIQPSFDPAGVLELIQQERVSVLVAVPTALAVILRLQDLDQYNLSSLLICGTGSAPCPPDLARAVQRRFGCALHIGFGATELGGGIAATGLGDPDDLQAETVGQPMPGVQVCIVDEEGMPLPPGQAGELLVKGESVMVGYWGSPDGTASVVDEEGWYHTGDVAVMDEQGYLRIVGRKRDVIIRGGRSIHPGEIEHHLTTHPAIAEAAVVGVPGGLGGEEIWAFILLEGGADLGSREVREYCRGSLRPHQIPQVVRLVDDFPRSSTGKPQKFLLRETALREKRGR
jgi:fatty-acyl-CoA synthase